MLKIQMFVYKLMNPLANEEGAAAVEYGIMVAAIAAVIVATVFLIGTEVHTGFKDVLTELKK